jgi:hypothetical protein
LVIKNSWEFASIKIDSKSKEVTAIVALNGETTSLQICDVVAKQHRHRFSRRRHLDYCNHKTIVEVDVPWVECVEHGVKFIMSPDFWTATAGK